MISARCCSPLVSSQSEQSEQGCASFSAPKGAFRSLAIRRIRLRSLGAIRQTDTAQLTSENRSFEATIGGARHWSNVKQTRESSKNVERKSDSFESKFRAPTEE
jgi:hypothetical protein